MKIRSSLTVAYTALGLLVCALSRGAPQAMVTPGGYSKAVPNQRSLASAQVERAAPLERDALRRPLMADSAGHSHRRASIVGGAVGAVAGGLLSAAYILNATAYRCVGFGQCPHDPHTGRRVVVITARTVAGTVLGAWVGHRIAKGRSN